MTLIIILYALFASSFTMGKILVSYTTPIFLTAIRMLLGGIMLLVYQYVYAPGQFVLRKSHLWLFVQVVLCGIYCNYILRFWALNYLPSSKTNFFYNFAPFFSCLYSYLFFNERLNKKQWAGLLIGLAGLIPLLINPTDISNTVMSSSYYVSLPEIAAIISVMFHSYSWIIIRKLVREHDYDPMMINGITMTAGGFLALITSLLVETHHTIPHAYEFFGWLLLVIIVSNIICYNLYAFLLKKYTATFLAFAGFLSPLFGALYGWALLHEQITWHFYASTIIVFTGLYTFYKEELHVIARNNAL